MSSRKVDSDSLRFQIVELLQKFSGHPPFLPDQASLAGLQEVAAGLKQVGRVLEERCKELLDRLQLCFTGLCQDKRLDVRLRLQLLEVIELRSLGWIRNQVVENYYNERYEMLDKPSEQSTQVKSPRVETTPHPQVLRPVSSAGDSCASNVDVVVVKGEGEVRLVCDNPSVRRKAKQLLEEKLCAPASVQQYTKDAILRLASSPLSREPPVEWVEVARSLPAELVRKQ